MSELLKLGETGTVDTVIGRPGRDAHHVAVVPARAESRLYPGQDVGITGDDKGSADVSDNPVGIVDPFLKGAVYPGQVFLVVLYPETVTGMRHQWEHPVFDRPPGSESEEWLKQFADSCNFTFRELIDKVTEYANSGVPWTEHGSSRARDAFDESPDEFWLHFTAYTGIGRPGDDCWYSPFSCSC